MGCPTYTAGVRVPKFVGEAVDWFVYLTWRQIFGYAFAVAGVVLTIYAVKVDPKHQLLIAVIAAFAQIMAALMFTRHGKADPTHAKRSVQRLITLGYRVSAAETAASNSFEGGAAAQRRDQMGLLSVELGYIGEAVREAVFDWTAFNDHLIELLSDDERRAAERYIAALTGQTGRPQTPPTAPTTPPTQESPTP